MLYIYLYILAGVDISLYNSTNDDDNFYMDIFISTYEPVGIRINLPWQNTTDLQRQTFKLGGSNNKDWNGSFVLTKAQWDILVQLGTRVESTEKIEVTCTIRGKRFSTSYLPLPLTEHSREFYLASYQPGSKSIKSNLKYIPIFMVGTGYAESHISVYNTSGQCVLSLTVEQNTVTDLSLNITTNDITGYRVTSNVPVSVYNGYHCIQRSGHCTTSLQQVPPTWSLGSQYLAGPILGMSDDVGYSVHTIFPYKDTELRVELKPENNNVTIVNNDMLKCNITASGPGEFKVVCDRQNEVGMFIELRASNSSSPIVIHSTKHIMTVLYTHRFNTHSGRVIHKHMILTPPLTLRNKFTRFSTIFTPNVTFTNFINIMFATKDQNTVMIDKKTIETFNGSSTLFSTYTVFAFEINSGVHEITIKPRSRHRGISIQMYGHTLDDHTNSYAMPVAFMDKYTMGPLPPGKPMMSSAAMIGLLTFGIILLCVIYAAGVFAAVKARKQRKKARTPRVS